MFIHKLRTGGHLLWLLAWANLCAVISGFRRGPRAAVRGIQHASTWGWLAVQAALRLRGKFRVARFVKLCQAAGVTRATLSRNLEAAVVLAEWDIGRQKYERAVALLTPHIDANPAHPKAAKCLGMRSLTHIWRGDHAETIHDLTRCVELRPSFARGFRYLANLAFMTGVRGEIGDSRRALATQHKCPQEAAPGRFLAEFLHNELEKKIRGLPVSGTVGVMFGAYHTALGHAILDPFHFYNLFRHRFDHLVLIHPPLAGYSRPTRLMASILEQYIEQLEIDSAKLASFPWQNLGELRLANSKTTFVCYNYWALNRMAYQARRDPAHPMSRGRKYLGLPEKLTEQAELLCRKIGLDSNRPLIVLHTREHGYHRLRVQSYRNTDVRNYIPAIRRLTELGYQVIRIGDRQMTRISQEAPGMIELPWVEKYNPVLDPYLLARCQFMISCQSGPCSLARAFGKPNLVVNGMFNHTFIPENNELFVFKRHLDRSGRELGADEALLRGAHLLDKSDHYEQAGIHLADATAEEILAATEEMLAGLDAPNRSDTVHQAAFRRLLEAHTTNADHSHPLSHKFSDYIGYSLPECRVSDAVCRLRPGFVSAERVTSARAA